MDHLRRPHPGLLERVAEDPRVGLLEADAGRGGDEVEAAHQLERVQELGKRPDPVAHGADDQPALVEAVQCRGHLRVDVPMAGDQEQLGEAPEEGAPARP